MHTVQRHAVCFVNIMTLSKGLKKVETQTCSKTCPYSCFNMSCNNNHTQEDKGVVRTLAILALPLYGRRPSELSASMLLGSPWISSSS